MRSSTLYFGSKASIRRALVYDKGAESRGRIAGTRFELVERRAAAQEAAKQFADGELSNSLFVGRITSLIDFREPGGSRNPQRRARSRWWQNVLGDALRLNPFPPMPERDLGQIAERWIQQNASLFSVFVDAGLDIDAIAQRGRERRNARHERLLRQAARDGAV